MAFISIDYEEPNQKKYNSVNLSYGRPEIEKKFNSGNFVKDWWDMMKYLIMEVEPDGMPVMYSSSVDHFIMDGDLYDSMYLVEKNGIHELQSEYTEHGIEFFVLKGTTPTWKELRELNK